MTDMHQTWILRGVLFVLMFVAIFVIVTILDANLAAVYKWLDVDSPRTIECGVFIIVFVRWLWGWLCRRVWVGREQPHV